MYPRHSRVMVLLQWRSQRFISIQCTYFNSGAVRTYLLRVPPSWFSSQEMTWILKCLISLSKCWPQPNLFSSFSPFVVDSPLTWLSTSWKSHFTLREAAPSPQTRRRLVIRGRYSGSLCVALKVNEKAYLSGSPPLGGINTTLTPTPSRWKIHVNIVPKFPPFWLEVAPLGPLLQ